MDEKTKKLDLIEDLNLSETKEITKEINSLDDLKDIENEEVTVKRIIKKEKYLILEAANPDVEPKIFTWEEVKTLPVQIIGKVIYARRDF